MNHFDPELDENVRLARERFIDQREKQLQVGAVDAAETALKYLFAINAGGSIAVLTYLGAISSSSTVSLNLKVSLALFFIGLVFIGIYRAFAVHVRTDVFYHFQKATREYMKEEKPWEEYYSEIENKVKPNNLPYFFGYTSFGCFLLGSIFGVVGLF